MSDVDPRFVALCEQLVKDAKRIAELEQVCAELYQVISYLASYAELYDHPDVIRALDQASQARVVHCDLLPWPRESLMK